MTFFKQLVKGHQRAEFFSSRHMLQLAALFTLLFAVAHIAGLREFTSVLNGTIGSTSVSWNTAAFFGLCYIGFYLVFVIVVPALILAAAILKLNRSKRRNRESEDGNTGSHEHPRQKDRGIAKVSGD